MKLLLSTPTGDQKAVLDYMNSTKVANKTIIARFIEKIDNSNFDDYMLILTDWVFKHYPPNETWDKILSRTDKNDRNLLLLGEFPLGNSLSSTDKDGKTYFNFQINTPFVRSVSKPNVDALDYMVVKFNKDFTIGGFLYKEGQVAVVPAMLAYLIMNDMKNQAIKTTGKYALYATLTVVTVGQIVTATTALELGVAGLDMLALGTNIYVDYNYEELSSTPQGKKYLEYWHIASLIYGGTRIYAEFSGVLKDLNTAQKSLCTADRLKVEVSSLKLYKGFFINKFPNIVSKLQTYDNTTQLRFFDDFLGAEESILTKLNTETNRIDLWKSFENEAFLAGEMRKRYIRDLGLVTNTNIEVAEQVVAFRKQLQQVYANLGLDFSAIAEKNIAFAKIEYEINGVKKSIDNILSISGRAIPPEANVGAIASATGKTITPTASSNRFFVFTQGGQDSEAKIFEYFMERLAREKGITIPNGANRSEYIEQILGGSKVKINIVTEMSPCVSCEGIINEFRKNQSGATVDFIFGIIYP